MDLPSSFALLGAAALTACSQTPTFVSTGTGGGGDTSSSSSGGPTQSCWGNSLNEWTTTPIAKDELGSGSALQPKISPDGLRLTFLGGAPPASSPQQSTRASRSEPFSGSTPLPGWKLGSPSDLGDFSIHIEQKEMLVSRPIDATRYGLHITSRGPDGFWTPVALPLSINLTDASSREVTVSEDGSRTIFARGAGTTQDDQTPPWRLFEVMRPAPVFEGAPFNETPVHLSIPPTSDSDLLRCPTLSPDGAHLFFATRPLGGINPDVKLTIWHAKRGESGWIDAFHMSMLDRDDADVCPRAITADGCELWLEYITDEVTKTTEIVVAKRTPDPGG